MRLFVAVEMNAAIERAAGAVIDDLRRRVARLAPRARISWAPAERMHITVRFIGEAGESQTQEIGSALAETIDVPPFDLTVEGIGVFPPKGPPRVFWAGLTGGREALLEVEKAVSRRLDRLVLREERPNSPHLTLARIKDPAGLSRAALFEGLTTRVFGTVHVDTITLFESRLSSAGATHVALQRTALRRP